ncbi:hypothetical protein RIF29_28749 [Crotalaria pallida]|uniref:Transcription repressor n=1 Tax=Crotalaria pallida TaxID=3830 RepID=A0AAN9HZN9_CROPI
MPKDILKTIRGYLSKIHIPSKKYIFSSFKLSRTSSLIVDDQKNNNDKDKEATLADIDRFLCENFKSLYTKDNEETENNDEVDIINRVIKEEESHDLGKAPQLGLIFFKREGEPLVLGGSNGFFMKHGSSSSSSYDEASSRSTSSSTTITINDSSSLNFQRTRDQDNFVVVLASSSLSPVEDFLKSMQGIVEARMRNNERVDWDFLEELLFRYMNLNDKKLHKFILSAFVDLVNVIQRQLETTHATVGPQSVRTIRSGRDVRKKKKEE